MEVYSKLVKCEEAMPVAANEVYLRTWRGRWCFLPAIPGVCGAQSRPCVHTHTDRVCCSRQQCQKGTMCGLLWGTTPAQAAGMHGCETLWALSFMLQDRRQQ